MTTTMMVMRALVLVAVTAAVSGSAADMCGSTASPITGFNTTEYLGVWYQVLVSKNFQVEFERNYPLCVTANYSLNPAGYVNVVNRGYNAAGESTVAHGKATQAAPTVAALEVSFYGSPAVPYNVIKMLTDEEGQYKVALVHTCSNLGLNEDLWVLSRTRTVSGADLQTMIQFAKSSGINVDRLDLQRTNQTNCPVPAKPAVDECGNTAPAVTGFNTKEYLGVWYQIAVSANFQLEFERSHPLCVTANYSLNASGYVNVVNTGYNAAGEANVARGKATQADPNVGALSVSFFNRPGVPYNVIKLLTDEQGQYSAALVWTCDADGLNEDLFVLSRKRVLPNSDYTALLQFAQSNDINVEKLRMMKTNQTAC